MGPLGSLAREDMARFAKSSETESTGLSHTNGEETFLAFCAYGFLFQEFGKKFRNSSS